MKELINCIIIDDEPLAVQLMHDYALKTPSLNIVYAGSDVHKAIYFIKSQKIDLIFLDIQMPELTGIELMQLFDKNHNFIITSAYSEYALDAFKFHVIDYLLKPISFNRFYQAVEKYEQWQSARPIPQSTHLFVRAERKHHKIAFGDILYIEGLRDYLRIHTATEKIMVLENLKDILEKLPSNQFIRVHRSYIIPTDKIKLVEGNRIQLNTLEFIPIGETYKKTVINRLEIE